jgi:hypothetical protein
VLSCSPALLRRAITAREAQATALASRAHWDTGVPVPQRSRCLAPAFPVRVRDTRTFRPGDGLRHTPVASTAYTECHAASELFCLLTVSTHYDTQCPRQASTAQQATPTRMASPAPRGVFVKAGPTALHLARPSLGLRVRKARRIPSYALSGSSARAKVSLWHCMLFLATCRLPDSYPRPNLTPRQLRLTAAPKLPCEASVGSYCPEGTDHMAGEPCPVGFWCAGG